MSVQQQISGTNSGLTKNNAHHGSAAGLQNYNQAMEEKTNFIKNDHKL